MRIVDVCAFYSPLGGGVRTYIEQKLALAARFGVDMTVIAPGDLATVTERGPSARIVTLPSPRLPVDRSYWYFDDEAALHRALDLRRPDFVEVSSPWRSPVMVSGWRPEIPKSLIMHADPLAAYAYRWFGPFMKRERIDRRFEGYWRHLRRLGTSFDTVVCASGDLTARLRSGGIAKARTIAMGVEGGVFAPGRRDTAIREDLLRRCGLGTDATLLLAAGRIAPEKRLPMLAEAVAMAGRHRPVGLVVLGDGRDKPSLLRAIGGNPHIRVLRPERDRVAFATVLASADGLLHGCEAETFCMVAAEACASGIPVIVPDSGGAADFARGDGGLLYRSGDRADAARAILELATSGFRRPATAAARTMEDHFADLFGCYRSLLETRRSRAA